MLKQRVITAVLSLIVVIVALAWGPVSWKWLVYLGSLMAVSEFASITGQRWFSVPAFCAYVLLTLLMWTVHGWSYIELQTIVAIVLALPVLLRNTSTLAQTSMLLVGTLYIGWGGLSISTLRNIGHDAGWLWLFMISIWATDTVAYFAGSWLKGPKLWPSISPKKTISGAVAGLAGAAVAAVLAGLLLIGDRPIAAYAWIGLATSLLGQFGDLVESAYKRSAGVKDSGRLLPGHGGLLDRIDSMLFAAPFAVYLITQVSPQ